MTARRDDTDRATDAHIGARLREARTLSGLSQSALGDQIGLTFQQIQKYEKGANRISASRLLALSRHLGVPLSFFFDGLGASGPAATAPAASEF